MARGEKLDIIIFGATGYTGKYAVEEIVKLEKEKGNFTWGVSGRNESKLKELLENVSKKTGEDLSKIPITVADVSDEGSLSRLAKQARVVVNCTGPYKLYGEPVVKACIANGAHHVDVSGEALFMEQIQLNYHKEAEEKGVYVISSCGFDSIPADLGTVFLTQKFEGELNSVELYVHIWVAGDTKGGVLNYGTWASAVHSLGEEPELRSLRRKLFPNKLPALTPKLKARLACKSEFGEGRCFPFPSPDLAVIERSQRFFYEKEKQRPVQANAYIAIRSIMAMITLAISGGLLLLLAKFNCGRKLLLKHPRFFSGGYVKLGGPSEETVKNTHFALTLIGKGWKQKSPEPTGNHANPPDKRVVAKVSGTNPAYGATNVCLLLSAITCLKEANKMPSKGGVYTPGVAFAKTSLIEELNKHDVKFEILSSKDL